MTRDGMDSPRQSLVGSAQMGSVLVGFLCFGSGVFAGEVSANFTDRASLNYTYAVERLKLGHSYGNQCCYVTLDGKTDVLNDRGSVRFGLRESINQTYYLFGGEVSVTTAGDKPLLPVKTIFSPACQETTLESGGLAIRKKFFLPFENNYLRSAHFLLDASVSSEEEVLIRSRTLLPEGVQVEQAEHAGHKYLSIRFPDRTRGVIWGSGGLRSFKTLEVAEKGVELISEFAWKPNRDEQGYALSFAYSLGGARGAPLNALFDIYTPATPLFQGHLDRVRLLLQESRS